MPRRALLRRPGARWPVLLLGAAVLVAPACASTAATGTAPPDPDRSGTTTAPPPAPEPATPAIAGAPGALVRADPEPAPAGARAWRIVYHSRDHQDHDIAVTGTLLVPDHPAPGTPLVTWGHPTTGSADRCAPSTRGTADLPLPEQLVARGWSVVATDYPGLGTTAAHPYLVGESEGRSVLDAARAAPQVPGSGLAPTPPVAIWGFSQGGHAAGFAAQLAPTYAPELPVVGVALAAPVSDVTAFAARAETIRSQFGVLVTIIAGMAAADPAVDPAAVFTPEVLDQLGELEQRCIGDINILFDRPIEPMLRARPAVVPPVAAALAANRLAQAPVAVPVLVVQGGRDDIVDPADTAAAVARWCALGVTVDEQVLPDRNHGVMDDQPFLDWTAARFAGAPAPSTCGP